MYAADRRDSIRVLAKIPMPALPAEYSYIPSIAKSDRVNAAPMLNATLTFDKLTDLERKKMIDNPM